MIQLIRDAIRRAVRLLVRPLNRLSGGRLSPNAVTIFGLVMHVPIALLIATEHNVWAAGLLVVFGLFDTFDGELARLQQKASARGMLLDASTDRMKEVLVYSGAAYALALGDHPAASAWVAAACGASLCVSYVKAKGEAAITTYGKKVSHTELNKLFSDGLLPFETRMALLTFGLIINQLVFVVVIIAVLASFTTVQRLVRISKALKT